MKDKYIVYINNFGTRFYYKNDLLHREAGPAVIRGMDVNLYKDLIDKQPYEEINLNNSITPKFYQSENLINKDNLTASTAIYYLDGTPYLEEDFQKIKEKIDLNNQLSDDLPINQPKIQKVKI